MYEIRREVVNTPAGLTYSHAAPRYIFEGVDVTAQPLARPLFELAIQLAIVTPTVERCRRRHELWS